MKIGQKFGLILLIKKLLAIIKRNIALICLIVIFGVWVFLNMHPSYDTVLEGLENQNNILEKEVSGVAKVLDGDSIMLSNLYEVRLIDIDAPEYNQTCFDKKNHEYFCGKISASFLKNLVHGKELICKYMKKDVYDRFLGRCFLGEKNINSELIKNGMAIIYSFNKINKDLQNFEDEAKIAKIGVWQGPFLEPRKYRRNLRKGIK